jgi:hypothetical protein
MKEMLIEVPKVAEILGVDADKVYQYIHTGRALKNGVTIKLPAINLGTERRATWRFYPSDVDRFLHALRVNELSSEKRPEPVKTSRRWIRRQPLISVAHGQ